MARPSMVEMFLQAQTTPYGPLPLSRTIREAIHDIRGARSYGIPWVLIAADLSEARRTVGLPPVDENTLRGVAGRVNRSSPVPPAPMPTGGSVVTGGHHTRTSVPTTTEHSLRSLDLNATRPADLQGTLSSSAAIAARLARLKELNDDEN